MIICIDIGNLPINSWLSSTFCSSVSCMRATKTEDGVQCYVRVNFIMLIDVTVCKQRSAIFQAMHNLCTRIMFLIEYFV